VISGNPRSRANSSSENASRVATPAQPPERYPDAQSVRIVTTPVGSHGRNRCFFVGNYGLAHGAELLFQIITALEERASIACASNAPFSEWGKTSPTPGSPRPSLTASTKRLFSAEFRVEAAHRVIDSGRTIAEVARELAVGEQLLGRWVRHGRPDAGSQCRGRLVPATSRR